MNNFSPEIELLLCCARVLIDTETASRIKSLAQKDIDWDYLVQISISHRVMPLLYKSLKTTCASNVPGNTLNQLRKYYFDNTARNLFLSGLLIKILALLKENKILAVPFKGPVLAESLYGDIALRQFEDLDILVDKHNVLKTRDRLAEMGYRPAVDLDVRLDKTYMQAENSLTVINSEKRSFVDIHWRIKARYHRFSFDLDSLRDRLELTDFLSKETYQICKEELLLYLCFNGTKDGWDRLHLICSIAELVGHFKEIDWNRILRLAGKTGSKRALLLGLFLAKDLFQTNLPLKIKQKIESDPKIEKIAVEICEKLFNEGEVLSHKNRRYQVLHFNMMVNERFIDKVLYGLQRITDPGVKDLVTFQLPSHLYFFYHILRPLRLAVDFVKK